ncbi:MAG: hypothetical protein VX309_09545, partial [Pseudomonadota bacterium]|nr:hypothetical protein [Pseudomonadota bacterium]
QHYLGPVAANPHGGGAAREAQLLLDQLEDAEEGKPWRRRPVLDLTDIVNAVAAKAAELEQDEDTGDSADPAG